METTCVEVLYLDYTGCEVGPENMSKSYYENIFINRVSYNNFRHGYPKVTEYIMSETECPCCNQKIIKRK